MVAAVVRMTFACERHLAGLEDNAEPNILAPLLLRLRLRLGAEVGCPRETRPVEGRNTLLLQAVLNRGSLRVGRRLVPHDHGVANA